MSIPTRFACVENDEKSGFVVEITGNPARIAEMLGSAVASLVTKLPPAQRIIFEAVMSKSYEMEVKKHGETKGIAGCEEF